MRKICSKCGVEKEMCEFYFRKDRNNHQSACKKCVLEKSKKNWELKLKINPNYDKERRERREKNKKDDISQYRKKWYSNHSEYWKKYLKKNIEKQREYSKKYYSENKKKINEYTNTWRKNKTKNDPKFRLINCVRTAINRYLKSKIYDTSEILGCTVDELKHHLEKQFTYGMTWDNHTKNGWHIDHIIPLSSAKTDEEIYKLCHYTNLQPLWSIDNIRKKDKI